MHAQELLRSFCYWIRQARQLRGERARDLVYRTEKEESRREATKKGHKKLTFLLICLFGRIPRRISHVLSVFSCFRWFEKGKGCFQSNHRRTAYVELTYVELLDLMHIRKLKFPQLLFNFSLQVDDQDGEEVLVFRSLGDNKSQICKLTHVHFEIDRKPFAIKRFLHFWYIFYILWNFESLSIDSLNALLNASLRSFDYSHRGSQVSGGVATRCPVVGFSGDLPTTGQQRNDLPSRLPKAPGRNQHSLEGSWKSRFFFFLICLFFTRRYLFERRFLVLWSNRHIELVPSCVATMCCHWSDRWGIFWSSKEMWKPLHNVKGRSLTKGWSHLRWPGHRSRATVDPAGGRTWPRFSSRSRDQKHFDRLEDVMTEIVWYSLKKPGDWNIPTKIWCDFDSNLWNGQELRSEKGLFLIWMVFKNSCNSDSFNNFARNMTALQLTRQSLKNKQG